MVAGLFCDLLSVRALPTACRPPMTSMAKAVSSMTRELAPLNKCMAALKQALAEKGKSTSMCIFSFSIVAPPTDWIKKVVEVTQRSVNEQIARRTLQQADHRARTTKKLLRDPDQTASNPRRTDQVAQTGSAEAQTSPGSDQPAAPIRAVARLQPTIARRTLQPTHDPVGFEEEDIVAESTEVWEELVKYIDLKRLALVRGSPSSGKTSLGHRAIYYAKKDLPPFNGRRVVFFRARCFAGQAFNANLAEYSHDPPKRGEDIAAYCCSPDVISIIDECHTFFAQESKLHDVFKNDNNFKCVLLTTARAEDLQTKALTPKELTRHQFWLHAAAPVKEVRAFMEKVLKGVKDEVVRENVVEHAFRYCGNHIGLLCDLLRHFLDHGVIPHPSELITSRIIRGGNGEWTTAEYGPLVQEIMALGETTLDHAKLSDSFRSKLRLGLLAPRQVLNKPLMKLPESAAQVYTWTHSWQRDYAFRVIARQPVVVQHDKLRTPIDFLLAALPHFASDAMMLHRIVELGSKYESFNEARVQAQVAIGLAACGVPFINEIPVRAGRQGHPCTLDFLITTSHSKRLGLEFLIDSSFEAHAERFHRNGSYAGLQLDDYLVVSFMPVASDTVSDKVKKFEKCALVTFSTVVGYEAFDVLYNDGNCVHEFTVPRNGVAHRFAVKTAVVAQTWEPPKPGFLWVKFEDSVFTVEPHENNFNGLKKAVKAEMQLLCPAPRLVVKDKDGKTLEVDAPLVANTKDTAYVVEKIKKLK